MANFLLCYLPQHISVTGFIKNCNAQNLYLRDVSAMGTTLGKGAVQIAVKHKKTNERIVAIMLQVIMLYPGYEN